VSSLVFSVLAGLRTAGVDTTLVSEVRVLSGSIVVLVFAPPALVSQINALVKDRKVSVVINAVIYTAMPCEATCNSYFFYV
jgi:hypothetical protein